MPIAASPTSRLEALRRLASTPPRDLPRAGAASGERPLQSLAAELRASGAASDSTGAVGAGFGRGDDADVAALGTVFDAAVDAGLGCLVLDYVAEVCGDPLLTSSDPVEAYLADGACVAAWCRASLASTRALVEGAAAAAAEGLAVARTRLAALVPLSEALSRGGSGGAAALEAAAAGGADGMNDDDEMIGDGPSSSSSSSPAATAAEAKKLAQCADVLDWCLSEGSAAADSLRGRYASEAEWRVAVSRRRAAVSGGGRGGGSGGGNGGSVKVSSTFLDALRARAAGSCSSSSSTAAVAVEYPPAPTPRAAAPAIFLSGGASPAALSAKLDLFAYCLADAGGAASLPSLGARFGSSSAAVARWRLAQLLDEALALSSSSGEQPSSSSSDSSSAALDAAVRAVPAAASPDAPYELAKALVALGRPEAALALLRARTKPSFSSSPSSSASNRNSSSSTSSSFETRLDEALTGLAARLECGLLSEAFTEARAAAARAAPVGSAGHAAAVRALAAALARWAADNGELPSVALFPLSGLEERALLEWLEESGEEEGANGRGDAALQTVLFHLQRGRAPEALLAAARAEGGRLVKPPSSSGGAARNAAAEAGALELLRQAARSLPAAQRALLLVKAPAPGGGGTAAAAGNGGGSAAALSSPLLRLAGPGEPAPEGSLRLVAEGLADVPAARLLSAGSGTARAQAPPPPLLLSLTSEAWMEKKKKKKGAVGRSDGGVAEEDAQGGEEEKTDGQQRRTTVQKPPPALRPPPPPRTRAASSAVAAAAGWDRRAGGGGGASAGAGAAATPAAGFLAPVAALGTAATAKKKARLQAVRL